MVFQDFRRTCSAASVLSLVPCTQTSSSPRTVSRLSFAICELFISEGEQKKKWSVERLGCRSASFIFFREKKCIFLKGILDRASFERISKRSATRSAPRGNTLFDAFALFRSKLSAPFLCSRVRRRSQKRNALFGNGNTAEINERERESRMCV